jgi:LysR family transcriptional regulator, hydrogen peroxide-inducible genes activator
VAAEPKDVNLRDLRYALVVGRQLNFTRAAEICGVTQPTLNEQIRKLERELGVDLFERDGRTIRVTPIGAAILAQARVAVEAAERIADLARAGSDPLVGPLRIGIIPTVAPYVVSSLLAGARERLPDAPLVVSEQVTPHLIERLRDGFLDGVIVATDHRREDLSEIPLYDEPFWLAVARNHPLAARTTASLSDVDPASLMLLVDGHCLRDQTLALCSDPNRLHVPTSDVAGTSLDTLLQLVGAGLGSTIVPALALDVARAYGVATIQLDDPNASRRIRIVHRPSVPRRAALTTLAEVIRERIPRERVRPL